jgi:hypothetical protein
MIELAKVPLLLIFAASLVAWTLRLAWEATSPRSRLQSWPAGADDQLYIRDGAVAI